MTTDTTLYHFSDDRGAKGIRESGQIETRLHPVLGEHMVWLTPNANAKAASLGLTRRRRGKFTDTDRMANRFAVEVPGAVAWTDIRDRYGEAYVKMLESAPGAKPEEWYVSFDPIPVSSTDD